MTAETGRERLRRQLLSIAPGSSRIPPRPLPEAPSLLPEGARLLLLRPDHLGDILFLGPALDLLRAHRPDLDLTLLVGPWSEAVARRLPGEPRVETLDFPWFDRRPRGAVWQAYLRLLKAAPSLAGRFDAALVFRDDDWWSSWLCALARIPIRACHQHPALRAFATHQLPASDKPAHSVAANMALVSACIGESILHPDPVDWPLGFRLTAQDQRRAEALLAERPRQPSDSPSRQAVPPETPWPLAGPIALHPGSGAVIKRWRPGAWAEALAALALPGEAVLLTGGPGEESLTAELATLLDRPVLDLAGRTDLAGLAAIYARCRLVLGPDSGPLHLAAAMGRPSLHLYGPADVARFGPWGDPARHLALLSELPCAPCGRLDWPLPSEHPCIRSIGVGRLVAAARKLPLDGSARAGLGGGLGRTL